MKLQLQGKMNEEQRKELAKAFAAYKEPEVPWWKFWPIVRLMGSETIVFGRKIYSGKRHKKALFRIPLRIAERFDNAKMWVKYRTNKHYRMMYVIKTELKPGWREPDEMLLYGSMAVVRHYVEWEARLSDEAILEVLKVAPEISKKELNKLKGGPHQLSADDEAFLVWKWWRFERAANWKRYHEMLESLYGDHTLFQKMIPLDPEGNPTNDEDNAVLYEFVPEPPPTALCTNQELWAFEEKLHQDDEDMLIRLAKTRRSMWT